MQEILAYSPRWLQLALTAIVSLIAREGIAKLWNTYLNRNKPAAETTEITVRAYSQAGDSMGRMMDRLDRAQLTIDRLRNERDEWEMKAFDLQIELRDSRTANGLLISQATLDNYHIRKQAAFIEARGLKDAYIALDTPKE